MYNIETIPFAQCQYVSILTLGKREVYQRRFLRAPPTLSRILGIRHNAVRARNSSIFQDFFASMLEIKPALYSNLAVFIP